MISSANYAKGEADFFDVLIGASQTAGGFWEMLGKQLPSLGKSLPGGAALEIAVNRLGNSEGSLT